MPIVMGFSVVSFHWVSLYVVPSVTITIMPDSISPVSFPSLVLVHVPLDPAPTVAT